MIQRPLAPARGATILPFPSRVSTPAPDAIAEDYARLKLRELFTEAADAAQPTPFERQLLAVLRRIDRRLSTHLKGV